MSVYEDVDLLRAACCIAGLDGSISEGEMEILRGLVERAGVGKASFDAMCDIARSDENFYEKQLGWTRTDPEHTIRVLIEVAEADGAINQVERIILGHFAEKIGLSPEQAEAAMPADEDDA